MTPYEFRTIFHGKTIWTVEHYCLDHADAFVQAQKSSTLYEVQVWQSDIRLVLEDQPCNARAGELGQRIASEFCVGQICDAEDELARLEVNTGKLH